MTISTKTKTFAMTLAMTAAALSVAVAPSAQARVQQRLGGVVGRERREREMADELASHLEMHVEDNVRAILSALGEDPDREGLRKTPDRVMRAFRYFTKGYVEDPRAVIGDEYAAPEVLACGD